MKFIFVDTLYWVALLNPQDQWHQKAQEAKVVIKSVSLITTEAVLIEVLNYFSSFKPQMRQAVAQIVYDILSDSNIEVTSITHDIFLSGLSLYEQRLDKNYSMVDCISMVLMRNRGLTEVLTHDKHFTQEGFTILL